MSVANLELMAGVLRVYDEVNFPAPYEWSCAVRWISRARVELLGVVRAPTPSQWAAIGWELESFGVEEVLITRYRNGISEQRWVRTNQAARNYERRMYGQEI